eukprot:gene97-289_t
MSGVTQGSAGNGAGASHGSLNASLNASRTLNKSLNQSMLSASIPSTLPTPPELVRVFKGHAQDVTMAAFHPAMHQVISGSLDGTLYAWHFKQQLRPFKFVGHTGPVHDVAVSADGSFFCSAGQDKTVNIWMNNSKGTPASSIKAHTAAVRSVDLSHDTTLLASAADDKIVKLWQVAASGSKFVLSFEGHTHWVRSARFAANDSNVLVTCGDDKSVRIWDSRAAGQKDRGCVFKFVDHLSRVNRAVFHPDGSCVASASDDHAVKIWDLRRKRLIQHYDAHQGPVLDVAFAPQAYSPSQREDSPAGLSGGKNYLASCSADRSCKLWDLQEGRLLFTMEGHEDAVKSVRFSPHGKFLVSGGGDNKVFCWRSGLAGGAEEELYEQPPAKLVAQGALHGARSYLYNAGGGGGGRSAGDAAVGGRERGDKASSPRGDASALRASASGGVAKKASASAVGNSTSA